MIYSFFYHVIKIEVALFEQNRVLKTIFSKFIFQSCVKPGTGNLFFLPVDRTGKFIIDHGAEQEKLIVFSFEKKNIYSKNCRHHLHICIFILEDALGVK